MNTNLAIVRGKTGENPRGPEGMLALSILFSCLLLLVRIIYSRSFTFLGLAWNLFLAVLPYAWTRLVLHFPFWTRKPFPLFLFVIIWLAIIPNSFYILTDLFHLADWYNEFRVPAWYDLVVILSFAWNGLLLGMMSVHQMELFLRRQIFLPPLVFIFPVMVLNALGVYIGRYLRFNSWDFVTNPVSLISDILEIFLHPLANHFAWSMILCFSALMTLMYWTMKRVSVAIS